jgi:hypothetical protein
VGGRESSVCGTYKRTGILPAGPGMSKSSAFETASKAIPNAEESLTLCRDATTLSIAERDVAGAGCCNAFAWNCSKKSLPADRVHPSLETLVLAGCCQGTADFAATFTQDTSTWKLFLIFAPARMRVGLSRTPAMKHRPTTCSINVICQHGFPPTLTESSQKHLTRMRF